MIGTTSHHVLAVIENGMNFQRVCA